MAEELWDVDIKKRHGNPEKYLSCDTKTKDKHVKRKKNNSDIVSVDVKPGADYYEYGGNKKKLKMRRVR